MMWLAVGLMILFLILDRTKVLKVNTLFMSVVYLISIPVLICAYAAAVLMAFGDLLKKLTIVRCINLGFSLMAGIPIVIALIYMLYKLCRNPVDRERWEDRNRNGKYDYTYDTACIRRQRTLLWIAYPLTWVCVFAAVGVGAFYLAAVAGLTLAAMNPFFLIAFIATLGLGLIVYGLIVLGITSPLLAVFMLCAGAAVMFMLVNMALTGSMLWRMRGKLGWPKWKYAVKVISMAIPVWSLVTLVKLSREVKKAII